LHVNLPWRVSMITRLPRRSFGETGSPVIRHFPLPALLSRIRLRINLTIARRRLRNL
jgi:hypothetical protein